MNLNQGFKLCKYYSNYWFMQQFQLINLSFNKCTRSAYNLFTMNFYFNDENQNSTVLKSLSLASRQLVNAKSLKESIKAAISVQPLNGISLENWYNYGSTGSLYTPLSQYSQTPLWSQSFYPKTAKYSTKDISDRPIKFDFECEKVIAFRHL